MVVLGIDPGSLATGYGVVSGDGRESFRALSCGLIRLHPRKSHAVRVGEIYRELSELIGELKPDRVAIETAFVGKNVQSALKLGQVRGAIMALSFNSGVPIFEYAPREVKSAVTGRGGAAKEQVAFMVASMLSLSSVPKPFDVTDALGVALCDLLRCGGGQKERQTDMKGSGGGLCSWGDFVRASPDRVL
ncbi:crossover junction endodeoxyribonuclease RuvC [Chlorobium phaeovibrioides]|uniref:Crossover junction endodeoxyribonuclease RuvC n=1 Tax=Chlorobium phaeovibrioides TaxID=1094 RepID=A0A3S0NB29_CHLPH|nr:crossover junction endodeoxyribonuclease RuvC [Chlorobium phaeovibrioides]KAA6233054.1 crossover junction endodeoxyribonuclease RuvC [Chlorobium phaeovibrioides]MWV53634.1 crossover junction endodeoxyribonuclease RuvC [Chlorobium phaeovibrioides]QEQ56554.1 crossover junction endodeoxyribonuclease RuvC [Chlorobium phaeovibrioides]RTY35848.1 crossover junction endodeoxyribonuclease RuvC [Chlorobium phaeovibrioides]RTY39160.1 crossover junction endodeoxyribonuclease RuvC [Chlorobium phaeovibri